MCISPNFTKNTDESVCFETLNTMHCGIDDNDICLFASYIVPRPPAVPDRYITLILHNKLGRTVRVLPSKGRHMENGYVVKSHSFMKVSIIIKGEKYVEPITFRGEDLETGSKLLLNKALFPISSTPSGTPDEFTNISITAEGKTFLD